MHDDHLEYALKGKTWQVYWLLLQEKVPLSVRAVQRKLHFSSPSVAQHHLERLRELGLVRRNSLGEYSLINQVKIGVLRHFVKLGRQLLPRYLFYAVFSTTFYIFYLFFLNPSFTQEGLFIILFGVIVVIIFWYETIRIWKLKPF